MRCCDVVSSSASRDFETCPVPRVLFCFVLQHGSLCIGECLCRVRVVRILSIEQRHELCRCVILHWPETPHHICGACRQECAAQPDPVIPCGHVRQRAGTQRCLTSREYDKLRSQVQSEHFVGFETA